MVLQKCSKTGDIIEPMVKAQWWIDCKEVAKRTIDDVNSGKLKIIPEFQKQTLFGFLDNIRDWCISRQLWWGHQCPIYLVTIKGILDNPDPANNDHWVAAKNEEEAINKASIKFKCEDKSLITVKQDDDVLDTWFSSSLLPLTCFGWPNVTNNEEFKTFFPTNGVTTINLSKSCNTWKHLKSANLQFIVKRNISNVKTSGTYKRDFTTHNIPQRRELVKRCTTQDLTKFSKTLFIRQQFTIFIPKISH
jgi:hypothetical protein